MDRAITRRRHDRALGNILIIPLSGIIHLISWLNRSRLLVVRLFEAYHSQVTVGGIPDVSEPSGNKRPAFIGDFNGKYLAIPVFRDSHNQENTPGDNTAVVPYLFVASIDNQVGIWPG